MVAIYRHSIFKVIAAIYYARVFVNNKKLQANCSWDLIKLITSLVMKIKRTRIMEYGIQT